MKRRFSCVTKLPVFTCFQAGVIYLCLFGGFFSSASIANMPAPVSDPESACSTKRAGDRCGIPWAGDNNGICRRAAGSKLRCVEDKAAIIVKEPDAVNKNEEIGVVDAQVEEPSFEGSDVQMQGCSNTAATSGTLSLLSLFLGLFLVRAIRKG